MKMTIQHLYIRSTAGLDSWMETQLLALQRSMRIDEALVRVECRREASPAYRAHVHLVTPGPDVRAEAADHTLRAAFTKVMRQLRQKIGGRSARRMLRTAAI